MKIPLISKTIQDYYASEIEPIELKIKGMKKRIQNPNEIINNAFQIEFDFNYDNADLEKQKMTHFCTLVDFANEELKFDISLKYRAIFNEYIKDKSSIKWVDIGKIAQIRGGKRLPKGHSFLEEKFGFRYVRVDDLNWSGYFHLDNVKYISEDTRNRIKTYIAEKNDILITIVGATVGKCGLVPPELDGVNISENFARIIVNDKNNYLPEYFNYCLQSKISSYQVDEYKGRSSQGKLALFRIKKIQIPDIKIEHQREIINKIKDELEKQELIKKGIEKERNAIEEVIINAIRMAKAN